MKTTFLTLALIAVTLPSAVNALADDDAGAGTTSQATKKTTTNSDSNSSGSTGEQNNRMKTLEGSRSPFSGQFNLTYSGSALSNPFTDHAPNVNNSPVPPPVKLSGTVSARYRIDDVTTAGVGIGVATQTPFQGPKNTTFSEPYVDVARSFKLGPIHNRADFQANLYTSNEYTSAGYLLGLTALNEAFYEWPFGLTTGLLLEVDWNGFSNDPKYNVPALLGEQTVYDFATDPYFEFALSKRVNLRSVIGIQFNHQTPDSGFFQFEGNTVYQTLGVGVQVLDAWFVYGFLEAAPYSGNLQANNTIVGFNTIINLF